MDQTQKISSLDDLWVMLEDVQNQLNIDVECDEMIFLLGKTRTGKSTIRKLLQSKDSNFQNLFAVGDPTRISDGTDQEIGDASGLSCTSIPVWFCLQTENTIIVDTPGEGDNRGPFQEIVSVHSLNLVANQAKRLKFLLLIPFQAFYADANRNERIEPFKYAQQILQHVSNVASIGLVVTKVDNHQPFNEDKFVMEKIIGSLKSLKIQLEAENLGQDTNANIISLYSIIESVISRKSIVIARRPHKFPHLKRQPLSELFTNPDDATSEPYIVSLCNRIIDLSLSLEYAEKLSQFSVAPSATTRIRLIEDIFPALSSRILNLHKILWTSLWEHIQEHARKWNEEGKVKVLSRFADSLQKLATFCQNEGKHLSTVLSKLADIFAMSLSKQDFDNLVNAENKFEYLQQITQVSYQVDYKSKISEIQSKMECLQNKLLFTNNGSVKQDIENWINETICSQISILQYLYLERQEIWRKSVSLHKLMLRKLECHMNHVIILVSKDSNVSSVVPEIKALYKTLNLPLTDATSQMLHQINLANMNMVKLGGYTRELKGPITQIKYFSQRLWESKHELVDAEITESFGLFTENKLMSIISQISETVLNNQFYPNLTTDTLSEKTKLLYIILKTVLAHLTNFEQSAYSWHFPIANTIQRFVAEINSKLDQAEDSIHISNDDIYELQECCIGETAPMWAAALEKFYKELKLLLAWYVYLNRLLTIVDNSPEAQHMLKQHEANIVSENDSDTLRYLVTLPVFDNVRPHGETAKLIWGNSNYVTERSILGDILRTVNFCIEKIQGNSSILVLGARHLHFSNFINNHQTLKFDVSNGSNLLVLCKKTLYVNQNLICTNGEIQNLFLACDQIKSAPGSKNQIWLEGKKGQNFNYSAAHGKSWGDKGENGKSGKRGGAGGNILILTQKSENSPIKIVSSGGRGGKGQVGGDGHCGADTDLFKGVFYRYLGWHFNRFQLALSHICTKLKLAVPDFANQQRILSTWSLVNNNQTPNLEITNEVNYIFRLCLTLYRLLTLLAQNPYSTDLKPYCFCKILLFANEMDFFEATHLLQPMNRNLLKGNASQLKNGENMCKVTMAFATNYSQEWWQEFLRGFANADYIVSKSALHRSKICNWTQHSFTLLEAAKNLQMSMCKLRYGVFREDHPDLQTEVPEYHNRPVYPSFSDFGRFYGRLLTFNDPFPLRKGGVGGNGGIGGVKGCPGKIRLLHNSPNESCLLRCMQKHGHFGECGEGGKGGEDGHDLKSFFNKNPPRPKAMDGKIVDFDLVALGFVLRKIYLQSCAGDCRQRNTHWDLNIVGILANFLKHLEPAKRENMICILENYDWSMNKIFTTEWFLDEYAFISESIGDSRFSQKHLKKELEFRKRLEKFKTFNASSTIVDNVLGCCYWKTLCLQLNLDYKPIILNLKEYLNACTISLKNLQESRIRAASMEHRLNFQQLKNSKIAEVKQNTWKSLKAYLKEIENEFEQQQVNHQDDMNMFAEIMKRKEIMEMVAKGLSVLVMGQSYIGKIPYVGSIIQKALIVAPAITGILNAIKPQFDTPAVFQTNALSNKARQSRDRERIAGRDIEILKNAINEHPELSDKLSKCLEKLEQLKRDPSNKQKLAEAQDEIFLWLRQERDSSSRGIDYICFDLAMVNMDYNLHPEAGSNLANEIKHAAQIQMYPLIARFLQNLKSELLRDYPLELSEILRIKDRLLRIRHYVIKFVKGLPSEQKLEIGFGKIELALETWIGMWKQVMKLEEEKNMGNFISGQISAELDNDMVELDENLRAKLAKVKLLVRAEILLLEYEKIQRAFLQWSFPYAQKYLLPSSNDLSVLRNILNGDECDISQAARNCQNLINHFLETYGKVNAQSTNEPWCWHNFYNEPGNQSLYHWKHNEYPEKIRQLFLGHPTKFVADLNKAGLEKMGALKVNREIELRFFFRDQSQLEMQKELDKMLSNFVVDMTHSGTSYYHVDGKQYVLKGEKITLSGNVETERNGNGKKKTENETRVKMEDFVISPYTEWTFRLRLMQTGNNGNNGDWEKPTEEIFEEFADKFAHCVDLHLEGRAKYLDEDVEGFRNQCKPEDVEAYYEKV